MDASVPEPGPLAVLPAIAVHANHNYQKCPGLFTTVGAEIQKVEKQSVLGRITTFYLFWNQDSVPIERDEQFIAEFETMYSDHQLSPAAETHEAVPGDPI
jgi:hypothetical protein